MDPVKQQWIQNAATQAALAGHCFAQMAASEAALESNFGQSQLAREANNLFGMKARSSTPLVDTIEFPTKEWNGEEFETVNASWKKYATVADCFADRMGTLVRLREAYPHYALALIAPDSETYIKEVSQTWSTDPNRAASVTAIYNQYFLPLADAEQVEDAVQD